MGKNAARSGVRIGRFAGVLPSVGCHWNPFAVDDGATGYFPSDSPRTKRSSVHLIQILYDAGYSG